MGSKSITQPHTVNKAYSLIRSLGSLGRVGDCPRGYKVGRNHPRAQVGRTHPRAQVGRTHPRAQ
eukprot:1191857-Prorocentrum_minimum.AAC.1